MLRLDTGDTLTISLSERREESHGKRSLEKQRQVLTPALFRFAWFRRPMSRGRWLMAAWGPDAAVWWAEGAAQYMAAALEGQPECLPVRFRAGLR